ncbi:flagellar basal body-associated FliL family protein [Sansalvadorimonas sp. 2012CJ34-2]|uniref:Flagellar protein FliL n=1 Tax=Parendozoicomonas callyspongiae TaxID=2942213 RepID=A0ABT0PFD2_9GAMM|nr:flagellar basal body-associated FliL family protein [Sansalvadorimonas sp. 2012CJ34-2]MCL6270084.1 flagellar basal body-associated FliL family protein [Sansalvadorimonas sp. 2012CJ34-2]
MADAKKEGKGSAYKAMTAILVVLTGATIWFTQFRDTRTMVEDPFYFPLDTIIVNLESSTPRHYLKVQPVLVTRHIELNEELPKFKPLLRNRLIEDLRKESVASLSENNSFEVIRAKALEDLDRLLKEKAGVQALDEVLFTEFVVQ